MRAFSLLGLIILITFFGSCSKDDGPEMEKAASFEVVSKMTLFGEDILQTRAGGYEAMTRAWSIPDGYVAYDSGDQSIGVCFTQVTEPPQEPQTPKIGSIFPSSGKWRANVELSAGNYFLYGYIPHLPVIKCSITDREGNNVKYDEGAILTLQDVPSVMPNDLCVVIGAKDGTNAETVSSPGLSMGDFAYHAEAIESVGGGTSNFVFLLFDHLYAALRINMRVHGEYDKLRTIKLKSLQLSTKEGEGEDEHISKDKTNITINLKATDGSVSPIDNIVYTPSLKGVDNDEGIVFWSSASGDVLTTEYQDFTGHFMPTGVTTLILTIAYDVYDKQENLIRENCKATNTMVLSDLLTGQTETLRGRRYTINMIIRPTYLYMLSEPDLDNPSVVIN